MIVAIVNGLVAGKAEIRADETHVSRGPGEIERLTGEALDRGAGTVIVAGGDGSVHEAASAFLSRSSRSTLAVFPLGTGNDFARCLGPEPRPVDAMEIRLGAARFFGVNSAQAGFGARVAARAGPWKRFLGRLAYRLAIATSLPGHRLVPMKVSVDGRAAGEYLGAGVIVANAPWIGGGMSPLPRASVDDGLLDIAVLNEFGRWKILRNAGMLRGGIPEGHDKIHLFRAREFTVESSEDAPVEADGEPIGFLPAAWKVLPRALVARLYGG
jgi:YegS/Rv2252/BmrU family lipid kinase